MLRCSKIICVLLILINGFVQGTDIRRSIINEDDLIFAQTICRHGDRNIQLSYRNDPWASGEYWPGGFAQLTNLGKQEMFALGEYLRKRYRDLIGNSAMSLNDYLKVYVQSTDVDRALTSSQATLAGLFPPVGDEIWNKNLHWQPIPVHTDNLSDDYLLATEKRCDHYDYIMLKYLTDSAYPVTFEKYKSLISYLEKKSGTKLPTITSINNLYDTLLIEQLKGRSLPDWAQKMMEPCNDFEYLAMYWFQIFTPTAEMKKLKSGYLLKEILDRFSNKTQGTLSPNRSLWMYFAHDITISNMLNTLDLFELHQPPYASCLLFELYQGSEDPYVQIVYRNSTKLPNPPALNIPGCGQKCPLTNLYKLYADVLPTRSFDDECVLREGEVLPPEGNPETNSL